MPHLAGLCEFGFPSGTGTSAHGEGVERGLDENFPGVPFSAIPTLLEAMANLP